MSAKRQVLTKNFTEYTHQYAENCEVVHAACNGNISAELRGGTGDSKFPVVAATSAR